MAPVLSDPNLRAEHLFIRILLLRTIKRRLFRLVHQLPHPGRHWLREGRDELLFSMRLGHRRFSSLDFRGGQLLFYVYFLNIPGTNEVFQDGSF